MSFGEMFEDPSLSVDEMIARLRQLEGSMRSLDRALYPDTPRNDDPFADRLAAVANEIRALKSLKIGG